MKATILAITFTCGCITSTYPQMYQNHKREVTADSLSKFRYDINPILSNKKLIPNHLPNEKMTAPFMLNESHGISMPTNALAQSNMPCYKPEGLFLMPVIKPDSTTRYTMLIK